MCTDICFLCGLEVKLALNCFGVNKQLFIGKPESTDFTSSSSCKDVNPVFDPIYKGTFAQGLL